MGSPYLSTNESIILSAHDIVINTVPAEAILTNQRLMLVDRTHPRLLPQDIPFSAIETVTIGDNTGNDPALSLSIVTPDGTRQPLGITYPQAPRINRTAERDEWAARLKELSVIAQHDTGVVPMELLPPWIPGQVPEDLVAGEDAEVVPAGTRFKAPSLSERRSRAAGSSTTRTIGIVVAALLIIAVVVVGIIFYAPTLTGQPVTSTTAVPTPVPTLAPTPVATLTETSTPVPTAQVTAIPPTQIQNPIPQSGVWVRVIYDGNFAGSVGAPGRFREIAGSKEQFFQIPAKDEVVTASVTKADNSGNPLTVEIYNEGKMLKTATITKPKGTLDLDADLKITAPATAPLSIPVINATTPKP
jgi:hypothetical protein